MTIRYNSDAPAPAPAFKAPQTITKEHEGRTDAAAPMWGVLAPAAISMPSGTADTLPGTDVKLVRGDMVEWVQNDKNVNILGNENRDVMKNQTETIHEMTTVVNVHERHVTVGVVEELQVNGVRKTLVTGESEENYLMHHEMHAPTEFETKTHEWGATGGELKFVGVSWENKLWDIGISAFNTDIDHERLVKLWESYDEAGLDKGSAIALKDAAAIQADVQPTANVGPETGPGHIPPIPL
jgi:hypothetical protein